MPLSQVETFQLDLAGELTVRGVAEVHGRLVEAVRGHQSITAQIAPDAAVDLTFVQLMEAARRAAAQAGGELTLSAAAEGQLLETLQRGGFLADPERRQFWLLETEDR